MVAMVTTQGLLLAKHGNERNYKTNIACLPYLGNGYEYSAHKTTKPDFWYDCHGNNI